MAGKKEQTILTFQRTEVKYRMSRVQYQGFMARTKMLRVPDEAYPHSLILNIYYDTDHDELVTRSLDKPVYKEKLRVRSYGIPGKRSSVFVELKKKYDGIVYKRRSEMSLWEAENFSSEGSGRHWTARLTESLNISERFTGRTRRWCSATTAIPIRVRSIRISG